MRVMCNVHVCNKDIFFFFFFYITMVNYHYMTVSDTALISCSDIEENLQFRIRSTSGSTSLFLD